MIGNCPNCKTEVDMYSNECPECGYEFGRRKRGGWTQKILFFLILLLTALAFYFYFDGSFPDISDLF